MRIYRTPHVLMTPDELQQMWVEPSHWNRDGSYNCTGDPRLMVPKRNGGGWTLNMAHPRAQAVMWGLLVVVMGIGIVVALIARRSATA